VALSALPWETLKLFVFLKTIFTSMGKSLFYFLSIGRKSLKPLSPL
jgi:hypothetical protein